MLPHHPSAPERKQGLGESPWDGNPRQPTSMQGWLHPDTGFLQHRHDGVGFKSVTTVETDGSALQVTAYGAFASTRLH